MLRKAADREDATDKAAITPGPLKPARELLGEMLLEQKQAGAALVEFEAAMKKEPNRFRALYGGARAAQDAGDRAKAHTYFAKLVEVCRAADKAGRPELQEARKVARSGD
jgi:Tfp pilus assembly protein PilF